MLLSAFVRTARQWRGSTRNIEEYGKIARILARSGKLNIPADDIKLFFEERQSEGFPAVHHSPGFEQHYRPAYRIVARHFLPSNIT